MNLVFLQPFSDTTERTSTIVAESGPVITIELRMITSIIIRDLDLQAHNRLLGQLCAMASIGLSEVLLNGIPGP